MIRYHIIKNDETTITDWEPEEIVIGPLSTAPKRLMALRREYGPEARIKIERDITPPRVPQEWVRFSVKEPDGAVRFSNAVPKAQADEIETEIRRDYPKAEILRQEWTR